MITFKYLRFHFVVCVTRTVNELATDIILNITSPEELMLTLLYIGSRLFELFSKEVRVNKQPGRPLKGQVSVAFASYDLEVIFWLQYQERDKPSTYSLCFNHDNMDPPITLNCKRNFLSDVYSILNRI